MADAKKEGQDDELDIDLDLSLDDEGEGDPEDDEGGEEDGEGGENGDDDGGAAGDPEDDVAQLRGKLTAAEEAAKAAQAERDSARSEREAAVNDLFKAQENQLDAYEHSFTNEIEAAKAKAERLEEQLAEAKEAGDVRKEVQLQRELNKADTALERAEYNLKKVAETKESLQLKKEELIKAPVKNGAGYTKETQKWIDDHPEFESDPDFKEEAMAAHYVAKQRGIKEDTPEYFQFIEGRLRKSGKLADDNGGEKKGKAGGKKSKRTAAPGTGKSGGGNNAGRSQSGKPRLSPEEAEAAEISGMSHQEYWNYKYGPNAPKK